jgi:hypothetical protein
MLVALGRLFHQSLLVRKEKGSNMSISGGPKALRSSLIRSLEPQMALPKSAEDFFHKTTGLRSCPARICAPTRCSNVTALQKARI